MEWQNSSFSPGRLTDATPLFKVSVEKCFSKGVGGYYKAINVLDISLVNIQWNDQPYGLKLDERGNYFYIKDRR